MPRMEPPCSNPCPRLLCRTQQPSPPGLGMEAILAPEHSSRLGLLCSCFLFPFLSMCLSLNLNEGLTDGRAVSASPPAPSSAGSSEAWVPGPLPTPAGGEGIPALGLPGLAQEPGMGLGWAGGCLSALHLQHPQCPPAPALAGDGTQESWLQHPGTGAALSISPAWLRRIWHPQL